MSCRPTERGRSSAVFRRSPEGRRIVTDGMLSACKTWRIVVNLSGMWWVYNKDGAAFKRFLAELGALSVTSCG